jgi:hypothetical protein
VGLFRSPSISEQRTTDWAADWAAFTTPFCEGRSRPSCGPLTRQLAELRIGDYRQVLAEFRTTVAVGRVSLACFQVSRSPMGDIVTMLEAWGGVE